MELRVLGSGTSTPVPDRHCAGYLVKVAGKSFLLDAGPGTLHQLAKLEVGLDTISHIFITHFHIDHVNDLPALLFCMKYGLAAPRGDITIHGPEGFGGHFKGLLAAYGRQMESEQFRTIIAEHGEETFEIESVKVSTLPMEHPVPAIGYRIDGANGKALTYSGDTAPCNNIIKLAMGGDSLLMECSRPDDKPAEGHSTTSQAAAVAKKAGVKTLILTHIYPDNDTGDLEQNAAKFFDGIVIAARDGMRITI